MLQVFSIGALCALIGAALLLRAAIKGGSKSVGGGLLMGGLALVYWATRSPETRAQLGALLRAWRLRQGPLAWAADVIESALKPFGVTLPASSPSTPALGLAAQPGSLPAPDPTSPPAGELDDVIDQPAPLDEGDEVAEVAPADDDAIIFIDPATVGRAAGDVPPKLYWLDPATAEQQRKAAMLQAQVWRVAPPELRPAFVVKQLRLGPWWLDAARANMTQAQTARAVAMAWHATDPAAARAGLADYMDTTASNRVVFDILGDTVSFYLT